MTRKKSVLFIVVALIAAVAAAVYVFSRQQAPDTRYTGAYVLDDGRQVFISPREGTQLRYRMMSGESAALWPVADGAFEGGQGFSEREPVVNRFTFRFDPQGRPAEATWQGRDGTPRLLTRLALPERIVTFQSGELTLRGKLVTPIGDGPFPVVVVVHGSEDYSGVDYYFHPYMYAANGVAAFVYDKRGTGESEGRYLQNFHVLADDVIAAVQWLRTQEEIDGDHIHLAGFSQGGWIAPLAALRDGGIRSVLVGFGVTVPVVEEDRWGYVYALQQAGFGEQEVAEADRINEVIEDIFDRRVNRWPELRAQLRAARGKPWYTAVQGSDSILGIMTESRMPLWVMRAYMWWQYSRHDDPPFVDRLYDSAPTLAELETPNFWILGGEDSSAPTPRTIEVLEELEAAGHPVEHFVFPEAEHGILRFETLDDGRRRYLGYEEDYFPMQIEWLRRQNSSSDAFPEFNRDPTKARIVTDDLERFWAAWDLAESDPEQRRAIFQTHYLDAGSPGLQAFLELRIRDVDRLLASIDAHPQYYASLRTLMPGARAAAEPVRTALYSLQELLPGAVFPDTYLMIGSMNSAGTVHLDGLLIGVEMYGMTPDTPTEELGQWHRAVIVPMDNLPAIIVHELIHFQQLEFSRTWFDTLLGQSIYEGAADFLAELIIGEHINQRIHEWALPREAELWSQFREVMHGEHSSGWLYEGDAASDRPADLGYFIGYRIVQAYYERAEDKQAAIREIVAMTDPEAFLRASGYDPEDT